MKRQIDNNSSDEVEKLQLEIETLKQQKIDTNSSEEVERLQKEIEDLKSQGGSTLSDIPPLPEELSSDEAVQLLQKEIRNLKRQLIAANKKTIAEAKRADDAVVAKKALEVGGGFATDNTDAVDEILTLQDEVSRLNDELAKAREMAKAFDPNDPKVLVSRYEELTKLSNAVLEKDKEIDDLKEEINILNDELDETADERSRVSGIPIGSTITTGSDNKLIKQKDDAIKSRDDEIKALQEINELLRQEMEVTRKDSDEAKRKLREEAQRSAMELEAFSETLRGVDELRKAAESMSRELNKSKSRRNGGGSDDVSVRSEGAWAATSAMQEASRLLDASLSRTEPQPDTNPLWEKLRDTFLSVTNREYAERRPSGGSDALSARVSRSSRQRRRRRRKRSDDESIISAFF
uniref:Uncharacterized protein n=1 Tax=Helicotheca tamesis TaxID=374047 RepID=A0A7S2MA75_9STRA